MGNFMEARIANADKEGEARGGMADVGSYNCDSFFWRERHDRERLGMDE